MMLWINLAGLALIIAIVWWFRLIPPGNKDQGDGE
jgi:hypothetical protein